MGIAASQDLRAGREPPWSSVGRVELGRGLPSEEVEPAQAQARSAQSLSERWSDLSKITINKQWELGRLLEEFKKLGESAELKFPATLQVMYNNKMYKARDGKAADERMCCWQSSSRGMVPKKIK
ncbi:hypothetical protein NDU88_005195 [Pleurodeles waltl]|uniref:Uncharacterized protein n=1 Tax=Pleurodeles waltl TaxID=8319 RepID=A0AAV7LKT1_PLEWA|nr:hypothetical protein NDU88_005195 [Pleurodeles waltl]